MKKVYQIYFAGQYLVALLTYGVEAFNFMEGSTDFRDFVQSVVYLSAILIQFVGCYCILSQQITNNVNNK